MIGGRLALLRTRSDRTFYGVVVQSGLITAEVARRLDALEAHFVAVEIAAATAIELGRAMEMFDDHGIGSGLVLVVWQGPVPIGVGDAMIVSDGVEEAIRVLDEQVARHAAHRVPWIDEDPRWVIEVVGAPASLQRVHESLLTIADTVFGTRGTPEEDGDGYEPLVVAAGVYDHRGAVPGLLPGPLWTSVGAPDVDPARQRRLLDLRTGILAREVPGTLRSARFMSLDRPGTCAMRVEGPAISPGPDLVVPAGAEGEEGRIGAASWVRTGGTRGAIAGAAVTSSSRDGEVRVIERLCALRRDTDRMPRSSEAMASLDQARRAGFDALLAEHRERWADRWRDARISITGDPEAERAVRFAMFHLMASVAQHGEAAVGARGLSGPAYAGHVFWDADVFVLPMLAATHPSSAHAMLAYRLERLRSAQEGASVRGADGVRFPWESADTGEDVTPATTLTPEGRIVPLRTGWNEDHIVADVAWAAWHYVTWTGDEAFLDGEGRALLTETARYWASRARFDADGRAHLFGLVGPDEYHGVVDDNAYTNVMARWNLRRASDLVDRDGMGAEPGEPARWRAVAAALVDGLDPRTRRTEQFSGYDTLEPVFVADIAPPPVAADILFGIEAVRRTQVIKQADVLMLHHLVPEEMKSGSLRADMDHYLPRTAHGSSLSPAIHAALLARLGDTEPAAELFRVASRIDLDDLTGTTAGGLHLAAMGGVWQALVYGFAGIRPVRDVLVIDPALPRAWDAVEVTVRFHGVRLVVRVGHDTLDLDAEGPMTVRIGGVESIVRGRGAYRLVAGRWKESEA